MESAIDRILFSDAEIRARLDELGALITEDLRGKPLTAVVILQGGMILMADLLRRIQLPLKMDSLVVQSYHGGTESSGVLTFGNGMPDVRGRYVLLLDDILDTGRTLVGVREKLLTEGGAAGVSSCVLLSKRKERAKEIEPDYVGFEMDDEFVVGYGLDYEGRFRNLPFIGVLDPSKVDKEEGE